MGKDVLELGIHSTEYQRRTKQWSKKWLALPLAALALYYSSHRLPGCSHAGREIMFHTKPEGFSSNGRTDLVQWDGKSLVVKGQRIFLWSGEFHTFRLPAPELWGDILEKTKAAGFNAISVYVHWGLVNPAPGELDFNGFRALEPLFKLAMKAGLWIVLRPGPYINAEVSAGGIPHWVTSSIGGHLRTNGTEYTQTWEPYIDAIADMLVKGGWEVGDKSGGPVIAVQLENEYLATRSPGHEYKAPYMASLAKRFIDRGVVVPLTYNDAYMGGNYATGKLDKCEEGQEEGGKGGANGKGRCGVELYGVDSYPQRFDCSNPDVWNPVVTTYHDFHKKTNPGEPLYIPEFQGGSFDAWGGGKKHGWAGAGYEACRQLTGPEFAQVFNLGLWANDAKMINLYMLYGGTTWGYMPFPGVYTSYDYGAAITETRRLTEKYAELKRQGLFLRSVPEFYAAEVIGNSTDSDENPTVHIDNPEVVGTLLRNKATGAEFYIVRHADSTSNEKADFRLSLQSSSNLLSTSPGSIPLTLPSITLSGRASKVLLRNVAFGSSRLAWSTASILYAGRMGQRDVLFLHGPTAEGHEFAIPLKASNSANSNAVVLSEHVSRRMSQSQDYSIVTVLPGNVGMVTVFETSSQLVLFADSETAGGFWAPVLAPQQSESSSKPDPYANFFQFGSNSSVLVGGPYLVRGAELSPEGELSLRGDLEKESMLTLIAELGTVRRVLWNGMPVDTMLQDPSNSAVSRFQIAPRLHTSEITVPPLTGWRYRDSLPEVHEAYDDSQWINADHTTTNIPEKPHFGDKVLYGCDYGFCEGAVIWRGHFDGSEGIDGARLVINGGYAFAASVWLNGNFLATTYGNSSNNHNNIPETDEFYKFPSDLVTQDGDNVLTVVQDNMGLEMTIDWTADSSRSPRGIRGYELSGGSFTKWRVQGKEGGYKGFKDKVRGVQNEGGIYGERQGWHLPEFDDSNWNKLDISSGLPGNHAGIGWFRTTFSLDIPEGYDVPLSFEFDNVEAPYRALLFVNGWLMGRRVANLGPQFKFPVPEGILQHRGKNTVAVVIWSMENTQVSPNIKLSIEGIFDSGYDFTSPL